MSYSKCSLRLKSSVISCFCGACLSSLIVFLFLKSRPAVQMHAHISPLCVLTCIKALLHVRKLSLRAVPILACGGDNSQVHLYVQSDGQVSSGWSEETHQHNLWEQFHVILISLNCSTAAQESLVPARTRGLGPWRGMGASRWVLLNAGTLVGNRESFDTQVQMFQNRFYSHVIYLGI